MMIAMRLLTFASRMRKTADADLIEIKREKIRQIIKQKNNANTIHIRISNIDLLYN